MQGLSLTSSMFEKDLSNKKKKELAAFQSTQSTIPPPHALKKISNGVLKISLNGILEMERKYDYRGAILFLEGQRSL